MLKIFFMWFVTSICDERERDSDKTYFQCSKYEFFPSHLKWFIYENNKQENVTLNFLKNHPLNVNVDISYINFGTFVSSENRFNSFDVYSNRYSMGGQLQVIPDKKFILEGNNQTLWKIEEKPRHVRRYNMNDTTIKVGIVVCI